MFEKSYFDFVTCIIKEFIREAMYILISTLVSSIYIYITLFPPVYEDIHVQNKTFNMEQRVHNSGE